MKRFILVFYPVVLATFSPLSARAQEDVTRKFSVWGLFREDNEVTVVPWFILQDGPFVIDVRYNFEAEGAVGFASGFRIPLSEETTVTPLAGLFLGENIGISPQLHFATTSIPDLSLFGMFEYIRGVDEEVEESGSLWIGALHPVVSSLWLGVDAFATTNDLEKFEIDVGPTLKVPIGQWYMKIWPSFSFNQTLENGEQRKWKLFVGLGKSW